MKVSRYWKAIAAAVAAGASAAGPALADGKLTAAEITTIILAVVGGGGITWAVPNKAPQSDA
ncbi:hypothetical protein ACIQRE_01530 [Streptomyces griseoluteus]|uniref:hypothetical protein n=1 Tax=Streptomyces griseoluteus TaxID=29306 RepID=UPI00382523D6